MQVRAPPNTAAAAKGKAAIPFDLVFNTSRGGTLAERTVSVSQLQPETPYTVRMRVETALGWSGWSEPGIGCVTAAPSASLWTWVLPLVIGLLGLIVCVLLVLVVCWRRHKEQMAAPKLKRRSAPRRKESQGELRDSFCEAYMTTDTDPMEESDPELAII